jgi:predicted CXXCH cytochrome family protein
MRNVGLKAVYGLVVLAVSAGFAATALADDTCVKCHVELGGELAQPAQEVPQSVHGKAMLSCADCHGGDRQAEDVDEAMSPAKGYVGAPTREEVPGFCGKCHSSEQYMRRYRPRIAVDQETAYWTSKHGIRLKSGDKNVADCTSCHGWHTIKSVDDNKCEVYPTNVPFTCGKCHSDSAYMAGYDIPTDQLRLYIKSVHGIALLKQGDLGAPACNDCHSNHGAVPPGVTSVANICGSCHASARDLFVVSPHKEAFDAMGQAECIVCHGNHFVKTPSDTMLGVEKGAVCVECHSEGDPGYLAAASMKRSISTLRAGLSEADSLISKAASSGVEMSDEELELNEVQSRLVMARNLIHSFNPDTVAAVVAEGDTLVAEVDEAGFGAFKEIAVRRRGLALSSLVILLVIVGLYLTLRSVESRQGRR